MANEKSKQLTPEQARTILYTRELERRKIIRDIEYFFENYMYIENKDGKTPDERSVLFKMFPEQLRVLKEIEENSKKYTYKSKTIRHDMVSSRIWSTWLFKYTTVYSCDIITNRRIYVCCNR